MIEDALHFQSEIAQYVNANSLNSCRLTTQDWLHLTTARNVLDKFEKMTKYLSKQSPQMINSLGIYYSLHDLLCDILERKKQFENITDDLVDAVKEAFGKYKKYYDFMDAIDVYYIAATLDPRCKAVWLRKHLSEESYNIILQQVIEYIKQEYGSDERAPTEEIDSEANTDDDFTAIMLNNVCQETSTNCDIELYYNTPVLNMYLNGNDIK